MFHTQGSRVASAVTSIHRMLGRKPLVFGNGLKHSFYWTGKDAAAVRAQYKSIHPELQGANDDGRPFAPNASENVIYYKVRDLPTSPQISQHLPRSPMFPPFALTRSPFPSQRCAALAS